MNTDANSRSTSGEIIAAINFDERSPYLIQAAAQLSRLRHLPLRLLHVVPESRATETGEFADGFVWPISSDPYDYPAAPLTHAFEEDYLSDAASRTTRTTSSDCSAQKAAEQKLITLAEQHGAEGVAIQVDTIIGTFPDTMLEHIQELTTLATARTQPVLLVVGASTKKAGLFKTRQRAVQRVMAKAQLPVLVLPNQSHQLEFTRRPLRLLVADDLSDETQRMIYTTENLVETIGIPVDVRHIHVQPVVTAGWSLSPEYQLTVWPGIAIEDRLINDHHETLKNKLRRRGAKLQATIERLGGRYGIELWHGSVAEELQRAVHVLQADVSIFGQHHFVHKHPVGFGQMPFSSMLDVNSAVLVAP